MNDSTDSSEIKSYAIYLMEDEHSWYIGSAWNKTPEERYKIHYSGWGGAGELWDAIEVGAIFVQSVLDSGMSTLLIARCLEEAWIANYLVNDPRRCLNRDLFPSRMGSRPGVPSPEKLAERNAKISEIKKGKPAPWVAEGWQDPTNRANWSAAISAGMAKMTEEAKAQRAAKHVEARWGDYVPDTHCRYGHEYTPENTYWPPNGGNRQCRECRRIADRKRQEGRRLLPPLSETHCRRGHEYTEDNIYIYPSTGFKACKICRQENAEKAKRLKEEAKMQSAETGV